MSNSEEAKLSKPEKPSSPPPDQGNVHVYPDWAAMQAYYGPRVAAPPYFNSAVVSGHAPPPYMWGPPQTMPPYGVPYAVYAHGGVYAHPGVPFAASPNIETPVKSSGNSDQGLTKKLKGFDGLAMSLSNGNTDSAEGGANHAHSQSEETESSSDGSNGNTERAGQNGMKRSREGKPTNGRNGKTKTNGAPDMGVNGPPSSVAANVVGPIAALELNNPPNSKNERELKRERRKQSNRESARRSRLRKQAEAEELAVKVESLTAENLTLKTELNRLTENSGKLKLENVTLMEKLKNVRGGQAEEVILTNVDDKRVPVCTENLLSRVDNSGSADRGGEGSELYEKKSGVKLRQLMDKSPRADAVAAG